MSQNFIDRLKLSIAKKLYGKVIKDLLYLRDDYLKKTGWLSSVERKEVIDDASNPLAWYSYPALDFLEKKLNREISVFEFGCGNSSLFYAKRCKDVLSYEDNKEWTEIVHRRSVAVKNLVVEYHDGASFYQPSTAKKFDVVVIDGSFRNECCYSAVELVNESGVLILDNAERDEYKSGIEFLEKRGFRRISFVGLSPCNHYAQDTSIFYRSNNIFKI